MGKPKQQQQLKKTSTINPNKIDKTNKRKKLKRKPKPSSPTPPISDSEPDSDPQSTIQTLLEPFTKDQLITLITDLSSSNTSLFSFIKSAADKDVSHRKIFVHGLGWDSTRETVHSVFSSYGELEDINVVTDRATGKCKGYAFITYKLRKSATSLLKNPKITVGNRVTSCQLASAGPVASTGGTGAGTVLVSEQQRFSTTLSDFPLRKIYVNNVGAGVDSGRLRSFFERFGEIENGPTGLDPNTGKFRGYAIFVFKTVEGARKVLEEPYKVFEGNQLHCQQAAEGKSKGGVGGSASITTGLQPMQPQMLAAVAAAQQGMALLGQGTGMGMVNPLYGGGMISNANLGALMGGYYGMMGGQMQGYGLGAYGGAGSGAGSGAGGSSGAMFQGLPGGSSGPMGLQYVYPSALTGQSSSPLNNTSGTSGNGYPPR